VIIVVILNLRPGGMIAERPTATMRRSRLRRILEPFIKKENESPQAEGAPSEVQNNSSSTG
jgi:hypothetical protein